MKGSLLVKPIGARFIHDETHDINSDTFVRFKVGMHNYQSNLSKGLGANPVWYDEFNFDFSPKEQLEVTVVAHDAHGDKVIGETAIDTSQLVSGEILDRNYMLTLNKKEVGDIHLLLFYEEDEGVQVHPRHEETPHPSFGVKYEKDDSGFPGPNTEDDFLVYGNIHPPHFSE